MADPPPDVQEVDGVVLSQRAMQLVISAFDELERVAPGGRRLADPLRQLRAEMAAKCTRVGTRVDASAVAMQRDNGRVWGSELMSVSEAATALGIEEDSVRDLCRRDRLPAMKLSGRWFVGAAAVGAMAAKRGN